MWAVVVDWSRGVEEVGDSWSLILYFDVKGM